MIDYQIAIPSFQRVGLLMQATLPCLKRHKADFSKITIFVADQKEYKKYEAGLKLLNLKFKIVVGKPGIGKQRIFINNCYPKGTRILSLDDDIFSLHEQDGKRLKPLWLVPTPGFICNNLPKLLDHLARLCLDAGAVPVVVCARDTKLAVLSLTFPPAFLNTEPVLVVLKGCPHLAQQVPSNSSWPSEFVISEASASDKALAENENCISKGI